MRARVNRERRNSHCGMLRHVMPVKLSILACRQQRIEDLTGPALLIVSVRQVPCLLGRHWRSMSEEVNWRRTSGNALGAGCLLLRCALVIVFHCFIFHNCLCVNNQNPSDARHGHLGSWGGAGFLQSVHVEARSTMAQNGLKWMTGASISFHAAVSYGSFVIAVRVNNHGHAGGNFWLLYQMYSSV